MVLRTASATVTIPKSQATSTITRFAATNVPKVTTARFFGSSVARLNEQVQNKETEDFEMDAGEASEAVATAIRAGAEGGSTLTPQEPPVANSEVAPAMETPELTAEPNGVYGVFVWNIPYRSTEREMFDTFTRFGKVHSLNIGRDARGLSRGYVSFFIL